MRVLVLGANGFLGSAIVRALLESGIDVRGAVRDPEKLCRRFPAIEAVRVELCDTSTHEPSTWSPLLDEVDAVVNAAGVLQTRRDEDAFAIHHLAPKALYALCEQRDVRRIIHLSAIGIDEAETVYARSKRAGEEALKALDLDWTILRPAIVFGDGSYGGTSMLRAIAAFPGITPLIGDGKTPLDVIHKDDLANGIVQLLKTGTASNAVLTPASSERMTLETAVQSYRRWLGLPAGPVVPVALPWVRLLARVGDVTKLDPITTTAIAQFEARLTGDADGFAAATGLQARSLTSALLQKPAESQDLWHARLFLLRPLVRLALAVLWLVSGLLGVTADPESYNDLSARIAANPTIAYLIGSVMGIVDLIIATALILGWRLKSLAAVQFVLVLGYTVGLSLLAPSLWGDPIGGLLKNIPILALICVHRVLEEER